MNIPRWVYVVLIIAGAIFLTCAACVYAHALFLGHSRNWEPDGRAQNDQAIGVRTLYVTVLDKTGKPISDLKHEDFSVRQNGVPQQVLDALPASATPLVIGVMVDVSGSRDAEGYRQQNLQVLSKFFASTVKDSEEAFVVSFGTSCRPMTDITNSVAALQAALGQIGNEHPHGQTALYDCLYEVADLMAQEQTRRKAILVFSDFWDTSSHRSLEDAILHAQNIGTAVFVFFNPQKDLPGPLVRDLQLTPAHQATRETGGMGYGFESPSGLESSLMHMQHLLENSYALKYRMRDNPQKGGRVKIKIEVRRKDTTVIASERLPSAIP